jgi:hypothetical protein
MKAAALLSHQLHHQIGAEVRETTALLGRERLPAAGGGHADQETIGGQLQHRVVIGRTQLGQRIRSDAQAGPKRGLQVVATARLAGASMDPASVQGFRLRAAAGSEDANSCPGLERVGLFGSYGLGDAGS